MSDGSPSSYRSASSSKRSSSAANGETIDDCLDPGDAPSDHYRLLGLVVRIHPAGQLDDSFVDRADVDCALAQYRIVAERLENALFELFGRRRAARRFLLVVIVRRRHSVIVRVRFELRPRARPPPSRCDAAEPVADLRRESGDSAVLLRDNDAGSKTCQRAERDVQARSWRSTLRRDI